MSARLEQYLEKRIKALTHQGLSDAEIVMRLKVHASAKEIYRMVFEMKFYLV
jgi:hypothetical protein